MRGVDARPEMLQLVDRPGAGVELGRAERAVAEFLDAFGIDRTDESSAATPARVARAFA